MSHIIKPARPSAGRPTREQAEQRHAELLECALELFLEKGFEQATIDAIAAAVGMTKRTVYGLYTDKTALFKAAIQRAIEQWSVPAEVLRELATDDIETTLLAVARVRMQHAISPAGLRLQRIINAESYRFPEIFTLAYEQGSRPTMDFLIERLRHHTQAGDIDVDQPETAASIFLSMVLSGPARSLALADRATVDETALEERIRYCVKLFLNGIRKR